MIKTRKNSKVLVNFEDGASEQGVVESKTVWCDETVVHVKYVKNGYEVRQSFMAHNGKKLVADLGLASSINNVVS